MKRVLIVVAALAVVAGIGLFVVFGLGEDETEVVAADYQEAVDLLAVEDPEGALEKILLYSQRSEDDEGPWHDYDWFALEIEAAQQMDSIPRLIYLFKKEPSAFDQEEDTVLMLARIFLQFRQDDDYDLLREHWRGIEGQEQAWFLLDADFYMFQEKNEEAIAFLKSKQFEGDEDIPRLIRLALMSSRTNLQEAWNYLTQAYNLDPKSPEVRAFRAQILESVSQLALARVEFMATFAADPENPRTRDELAEFYRRNRQYNLALQTWKDGLEEFSADFIWSKAYFWNRLVLPLDFEWANVEVPEGNLEPFVSYVMDLGSDKWWDEEAFRVLPETRFYLTTRQETFWLRLFHELKNGNEASALSLMEQNHFQGQSWEPSLENALRQILTFRQTGALPPPADIKSGVPRAQGADGEPLFGKEGRKHSLIKQLHELAESGEPVPEELRALLMSEEAFSAAFLASGWVKVALDFNRLTYIPDTLPRWYVYGLTQARKVVQGADEALEFLGQQTTSKTLDLLRAELLIELERDEDGVAVLKELAKERDTEGIRASWLLASHYLNKGEFSEAKVTVISQPELGASTVGKEMIARITFLEGDEAGAEQLYTELKDRSFIAKSYLAKRAFDRKDFGKAKQLTWEMIQQYPDIVELRANLKAIIEAEKGVSEGAEALDLVDPAEGAAQ